MQFIKCQLGNLLFIYSFFFFLNRRLNLVQFNFHLLVLISGAKAVKIDHVCVCVSPPHSFHTAASDATEMRRGNTTTTLEARKKKG